MFKIRFVPVSALNGRINQARTVFAQGFKECARAPAVLGTGTLIARIECSVAPIGPEVGPGPKRHHSEHALLNAKLASWMVALKQMQFLESFENPEREIDFEAERI